MSILDEMGLDEVDYEADSGDEKSIEQNTSTTTTTERRSTRT